ncbi:MAG: transglycosylase domain-containing protein [Holosporales bacterium]|jgi:penicillin-binding protein 1A|nr:transglycosylase domain-containing protein [Holosporales bacterium]
MGRLFRCGLYCSICGCIVVAVTLMYFAGTLPDLTNLKTAVRIPAVSVQTYDGKVIGSYGDLYEDVVTVEELPKHVPLAFMAVEDKRFFQHFGIDFVGFFRAIYQNYVAHRVVQGGSTITQQLAKNILITEGAVTHHDRSISRKVRELLLAFWLEHRFTKSEILMMYLNRVYFGAGTYGIDAASRKYFNKSAKQLSIFEAAILAGLLKAPSKYNPSNHPNYAHERAMVVLQAMEGQGLIKSAKEIETEQPTKALSGDTSKIRNQQYFCDFVYEQAKKLLGGEIEDDIVVITTFDERKQEIAEEAVSYYIETEGKNYNFSQAAFICMARDGAIQAMIGGNGYSATQFNRATAASRLPGSAFKLFIYGAALEYGYQLTDMISDRPVSIAGWNPKNYKWQSRGEVSVLDGFTFSVNAVSIRLAQSVGLRSVSKFASKLGIFDVSVNDMSVALGTTPVTLKDLTAAYTSFMDGMPIWAYCVTEIRTRTGEVLFRKSDGITSHVIDDEVLGAGRKLLRNVVQNGTGRAANANEHVYAKTGTNGDSDAWFIGFYDPPNKKAGCSLGIWIGNDLASQRMAFNSTGGRIPARIARRFIDNVVKVSNNSCNQHVAETGATGQENEQEQQQAKGLGSLLTIKQL